MKHFSNKFEFTRRYIYTCGVARHVLYTLVVLNFARLTSLIMGLPEKSAVMMAGIYII